MADRSSQNISTGPDQNSILLIRFCSVMRLNDERELTGSWLGAIRTGNLFDNTVGNGKHTHTHTPDFDSKVVRTEKLFLDWSLLQLLSSLSFYQTASFTAFSNIYIIKIHKSHFKITRLKNLSAVKGSNICQKIQEWAQKAPINSGSRSKSEFLWKLLRVPTVPSAVHKLIGFI